MKTEMRVPRCRSTSKNSPPLSALRRPKKFWSRDRCPELEMGKNSATPWTKPRKADHR